MAQQSGLADSGVAAKHQDLALTQPHSGDEPVERLTFTPAVDEARRRESGDRHPGPDYRCPRNPARPASQPFRITRTDGTVHFELSLHGERPPHAPSHLGCESSDTHCLLFAIKRESG
jgi:hypothetical protein